VELKISISAATIKRTKKRSPEYERRTRRCSDKRKRRNELSAKSDQEKMPPDKTKSPLRPAKALSNNQKRKKEGDNSKERKRFFAGGRPRRDQHPPRKGATITVQQGRSKTEKTIGGEAKKKGKRPRLRDARTNNHTERKSDFCPHNLVGGPLILEHHQLVQPVGAENGKEGRKKKNGPGKWGQGASEEGMRKPPTNTWTESFRSAWERKTQGKAAARPKKNLKGPKNGQNAVSLQPYSRKK